MLEYKNISFYDLSQRESYATNSDCNASLRPIASRFLEDFVQQENLGKGQFGKVMRCQNKLDQLEYAVKITVKKIRSKLDLNS